MVSGLQKKLQEWHKGFSYTLSPDVLNVLTNMVSHIYEIYICISIYIYIYVYLYIYLIYIYIHTVLKSFKSNLQKLCPLYS